MAQIGYHISKGLPLWGFSVRTGNGSVSGIEDIMQGCKSGYHRCLEWKAVRILISLQNQNRSMTDWKGSL